MTIFSKVISIIFHPVFTVVYSYLIYFNIQNIYNQMLFLAAPKIYWALLFFLFLMVVFFPLATIYIMYRNKSISSMSIPIRKERLPVLILVTIYYLMTYYIFRYWNSTLLNLFQPYLSFFVCGPCFNCHPNSYYLFLENKLTQLIYISTMRRNDGRNAYCTPCGRTRASFLYKHGLIGFYWASVLL